MVFATFGCDEAPEAPSASARCFPVAGSTELRRGTAPGEKDQGTSLQGRAATHARPGERDQGGGLQGGSPGIGRLGEKEQGVFLGLSDLNGVQLAIHDRSLVLADGRLALEGSAPAPLDGMELRATTRDSRELLLSIGAVELVDDLERIELLVDGQSVCEPGDHGIFVPGRWNESGAHIEAEGVVTYACMSGVIAKCASWGYAPWTAGTDAHQACTRLARADYCGDGTPWTLDGTTIVVYDALGIEHAVAYPEYGFEAAWGVDGAICVDAPRYAIEDADGRAVLPECFADLPACESLDDPAATGALLANDSSNTSIRACD
jgi:hypothetical protein